VSKLALPASFLTHRERPELAESLKRERARARRKFESRTPNPPSGVGKNEALGSRDLRHQLPASWNFLFQRFHPSIRELRLDPRRGFVEQRAFIRVRLALVGSLANCQLSRAIKAE